MRKKKGCLQNDYKICSALWAVYKEEENFPVEASLSRQQFTAVVSLKHHNNYFIFYDYKHMSVNGCLSRWYM